jgi:hypothetical protein
VRWVALVLVLGAPLAAVVLAWWCALIGMSPEIAAATFVTILVSFFAGLTLAAYFSDPWY